MKFTTSVSTLIDCSIERAFKTPMLSDVTKIHTGFGPFPRVTHCTEDETWGKIGGSRIVHNKKSLFTKGGEAALDTVLERIENKYWKIEINNFKTWNFWFYSFVGEWSVSENDNGKVQIDYQYTMYSKYWFLAPFQWLFTKILWRAYIKHALDNIKGMIYEKEPYLFD